MDSPRSSAYFEYGIRLVELSSLIAQGKCDSDEADVVRDLMEKPWRAMSQEERTLMRGLSADLSLVDGEENFTEVSDEATLTRLSREMGTAQSTGQWRRVLELLRTRPKDAPKEVVAAIRGHAYLGLEEFFAARPFLEYALRYSPDNAIVRYEYLTALFNLGEEALAGNLGAEWHPRGGQDAIWMSAWVTSLLRLNDGGDSRSFALIEAASSRLGRITETASFHELPNTLRLHAWLALSVASLRVGDLSVSIRAWEQSASLHHQDDETKALLQFHWQEIQGTLNAKLMEFGLSAPGEALKTSSDMYPDEHLAPGIRLGLIELETGWEVFDSEGPRELVATGA